MITSKAKGISYYICNIDNQEHYLRNNYNKNTLIKI